MAEMTISELAALIEGYQASYYNGEEEVSDADFDALWDELRARDPKHPLLNKVGADGGNFSKAAHVMPMGSQEKAANPAEFLKWAEKHPYDEYLVEYKLDGASLELQYREGKLFQAVTRGDGSVGDVITQNARKMQGVVAELKIGEKLLPLTGGIRGEVLMTHQVHEHYFSDKANCRNAANGLMKRKDGEGAEHLKLVAYDAFFPINDTVEAPFSDEEEKMKWLSILGFTTAPLYICTSVNDVISYREEIAKKRNAIEYDIDGLVVKERKIDPMDMQRARPDRQIAFKFELERAESVLRTVEWSESGATYTPIALFDPVQLAGTTVKRASLVNPDTIRKLGVQIGSRVSVTKRGEIIPKIESVVDEAPETADLSLFAGIREKNDITFPTHCGTCGAELIDEGTRLFCPNPACPKRIHHRIEKWVAVMDLRDLGAVLLKSLFDAKRINSIADLYTLSVEDLTPYFLDAESLAKEKVSKGAQKVFAVLQAKRQVSLAQFVAGFDIENIGELLVVRLVDAGYDTPDKLFAASPEELAEVKGFAEISAKALVGGLAENRAEMRLLIEKGYVAIKPPVDTGTAKLAGLSFCFTGELQMKRADAEKLVKEAGGSVKSGVTKDLSYLVTNDTASGSAKNEKAQKLGVAIIDEDAFRALL